LPESIVRCYIHVYTVSMPANTSHWQTCPPIVTPSLTAIRHCRRPAAGLPVNEPEHVVEDVVAAAVRQQLEALRVAHGLLLLIDLDAVSATKLPPS
jgi:hypothetical protein